MAFRRSVGAGRNRRVSKICEFGLQNWKIATIDSNTMTIREFPLPDPGARPRRLAIGPDDVIWYADFARGRLRRLDPATGEVKEWPSPSGPKSQPYGMVFTKGAVWYSESLAKPNTIVRFDPKTETFQSWAIPGGGDIVRNMDVDRDGNPVMANTVWSTRSGLSRSKASDAQKGNKRPPCNRDYRANEPLRISVVAGASLSLGLQLELICSGSDESVDF
jgi:DNA-binding beta-propeller fold protein YncE